MPEQHRLAVIDEAACIGCTKCIAACPVDAIIGSKKVMHTVIASECIGCELCVAPCPVDCIEMQALARPLPLAPAEREHRRTRVLARKQRLTRNATGKAQDIGTATADKRAYLSEMLA